jgi:hypothetical protein
MIWNTVHIDLVRITADARDASYPEVKRRERILPTFSISQTGLLEIRHDKAAETAIDVKTNIVRDSQGTEGYYVVLVAVWEVDGGAYELGDEI